MFSVRLVTEQNGTAVWYKCTVQWQWHIFEVYVVEMLWRCLMLQPSPVLIFLYYVYNISLEYVIFER